MVCGASNAVSPTIVVVIIFCNPCFKKVRYCVCGSECDSEIDVLRWLIVRTCGPKYVNVIGLL
jgi:hypothetical protein